MRILILGGGYGGLALARGLAWWLKGRRDHAIALVDRNREHQLIVRLHEVAAASIAPDEALVPYERALRDTGVEFHQAEVTAIDAGAGCVRTSDGGLDYGILVAALGSETEYYGLPGVRENSFPIGSWQDAVRLRRHLEHQAVRARHERDAERRQAHLTCVIGGGGYTGIEVAAEVADRLRDLAALHGIPDPWRVLLVEAREEILPGMPASALQRAVEALREHGVEVRLGTPVVGARPGEVLLSGGEAVAAGTFVWAGGVRASPVLAGSGLPTGAGGRACVDAYLRWGGQERVFAIGDGALTPHPETGEPLPRLAQVALQQAEHTARNVCRLLANRPLLPFFGHVSAEVVSLGRRDAVALLRPVVVSGPDARFLKHLSYRRYRRSIGA